MYSPIFERAQQRYDNALPIDTSADDDAYEAAEKQVMQSMSVYEFVDQCSFALAEQIRKELDGKISAVVEQARDDDRFERRYGRR